jgi:hypothetical protein
MKPVYRNLDQYSKHPVLCGTDRPKNVGGIWILAFVHVCCWIRGCEKPYRTGYYSAGVGHLVIRSCPWIFIDHGYGIYRSLSGKPARGRMCEHLRDFYGAGMEYDLRVLPFDGHHSE